MNWIFIVILLLLTILTASLFIVFWRISRVYRDIVAFITSPDGKSQSPLAIITNQLINQAADTISVKAKTTIMGMMSGQARGEQAIVNDIVEAQAAEQSPGLMGLISQIPGLKKRLIKNPALLQFAMSKLGKLGGGGGGPALSPELTAHNSGPGVGDYNSRLNKYGG